MAKKIEQLKTGLNGTFEFPFIEKDDWLYTAIQLKFSNGAAFSADVVLQASLDRQNWDDITGTAASLSGASGSQLWDYPETAIPYLRVRIYNVSGSADIDIDVNLTGWGGKY